MEIGRFRMIYSEGDLILFICECSLVEVLTSFSLLHCADNSRIGAEIFSSITTATALLLLVQI